MDSRVSMRRLRRGKNSDCTDLLLSSYRGRFIEELSHNMASFRFDYLLVMVAGIIIIIIIIIIIGMVLAGNFERKLQAQYLYGASEIIACNFRSKLPASTILI